VNEHDFLLTWKKSVDNLRTPFIAMHAMNENWGFFSTYFPNRTANWGTCCFKKRDLIMHEFLNHDMTVMMITNQHNNITHPKVEWSVAPIPITRIPIYL